MELRVEEWYKWSARKYAGNRNVKTPSSWKKVDYIILSGKLFFVKIFNHSSDAVKIHKSRPATTCEGDSWVVLFPSFHVKSIDQLSVNWGNVHTTLEKFKTHTALFLRKRNETSWIRSFSKTFFKQYWKNLKTPGFRLCVENRAFGKLKLYDYHACEFPDRGFLSHKSKMVIAAFLN